MDNLRLGIDWEINDAQLNAGMAGARRQITSTAQTVEQLEGQVTSSIKNMASAMGGLLSIGAAKEFIGELTRVRGEFQQIEVAYTTMLKSRTAASQLMSESVSLAAKTPFGLMDVATSTKQLVAYGVEAKVVTSTIEMLGNVAAGVGSNIGDIAYLYGTLKTQGRAFQQDINQFTNRGIPIIAELAKQFGVAESEVKKLVENGKVGFPQIEKAFKSLTSESGIFYNLMREQSKTLTGQLANLGDAWDSMLNNIGKNNEGLLSDGISLATNLVENYEKVIEVVEQLIIVYGAYKAATIVTTIIQQTQALGSLTAALKSATGAQSLFNLVGKANPVGLIVAGITAAISAFYLYKQSVNTASDATSSIQSEMNKAAFSANSLFDSLKKTKKGTEEHAGAIRLVNERYGKYLDNLLTTKSSLDDIEKAQKRVTSALLADIAVRSGQSKIEEALTEYTEKLEDAFDSYAKAFEKSKGSDRLQEFWKGLNTAMDKSLSGAGNATQNARKFAETYLKDVGTLRYDLYDGTFTALFRDVYNKRINVDKEVNQIKAFVDSFAKDLVVKAEEPDAVTPVATEVDKNAEKKEAERQKKITEELKKELDDRAEAFQKYADFKKRVNKEEADERYGNDLGGYEDYHKYTQSKTDEVLKGRDPMTLNKYEFERYDMIREKNLEVIQKTKDDRNEAYAKEYEEQKEQYKKLLETVITYDQARKNKIAEFEKDKAKLIADGKNNEALVLEEKHIKDLGELDDANIQKLDSYKALFQGIDRLTDAGARDIIAKVKALLAGDSDMSPDLRKKIKEALKETTEALDERFPERVMTLSSAFGEMAQEIGRVNEELGSMLQGVSNVLRATVQIKDGFKGLQSGLTNYAATKKEGGGGLMGSISAIAGIAGPVGQIVGAVGSVVSGVVGFFNAAKESARQAEKQLKEYQDIVLAGEFEYNRLLRERAREHESINELTVEQIKLQQELLKLQTTDAESDFNAILKRIQSEGKQITGQKTEKYGGFLGIGKKTRVVDITSGLAGYTYAQLEELYTSKKMTEATQKLFEELQKSKGEIDGLAESWDEAQSVILDKMSGGITADSISSTIIQGFKDGKRGAIDFADDIEGIIQNALLSAMSATVLEKPLQDLIKKFREDSKDGLSQDEIDAFKKGYGDIVKEGLDALKIIEGAYGTIGGTGSSSVKNEGIERMTAQAGAEFTGISRAHLDVSKQNLLAVQKVLEFEAKSYDQLVAQVRHLKAIEENTAASVIELKNVVTELKAIKDNTKGGYYGG